MSGHTPGTWHFSGVFSGIEYIYAHDLSSSYLASSRVVAAVYSSELAGGDDEMRANGRLIAAAPETAAERDRLREVNAELLAALKNLYTATPDNEGGELGRACMKARAAIAKAEARS